jgi:hypothetical protein
MRRDPQRKAWADATTAFPNKRTTNPMHTASQNFIMCAFQVARRDRSINLAEQHDKRKGLEIQEPRGQDILKYATVMNNLKIDRHDHCKSLLTSLFQREAFPLFGKEGPGEISYEMFTQLCNH